ncbi:DDE Tnp4 domain-containing protein [Plasmodiophora brassicae]
MPRALFDEIHERVTQFDEYFLQKKDALGVPGFTSLQKVVCAVRMLTSGDSAHELDDKFRLAESTAIENLHRFCNAIIGWKAGWPGCIGSLDCMHVKWKNCPSAWAGMFTGKEHEPTVVIEAIADHECRIWHFFCGCPGSLNDLNVLDRSPVLNSQITGEMPTVLYSVGQNEYSVPYYLVDGIYPGIHCFMSTISNPSSRAQKLFATKQEAKRKDIERAFGILQHRFHILTIPMKLWHRDALCVVVKTCVILHNLIIDYERKHSIDSTYIEGSEYVPEHPFVIVPAKDEELSADAKLVNMSRIHNRSMHARLKEDLVEHLWSMFGGADDSS